MTLTVASDEARKLRKSELHALDIQQNADLQEERKNRDFVQVYGPGFRRIRQLAKENAGAATLYALFAEHIDASCGAVIADQDFLASNLGVSTRTIRRYIDYLENAGAVTKIPLNGNINAYALNPNEVWKGYDNGKDYAAFKTKTLVQKNGEIQRRLKLLMTGQNPNEQEDEA